MLKRILFIAICVLQLNALYAIHALNAVIGDAGWKSVCGENKTVTETEKIAAHLQFVEEKLRANFPEGLTDEQRRNRLKLLDDLHVYGLAKKFPMNEHASVEREPTFIDCEGNSCAVGYLVEQSAGMEMAENLNGLYHNSYISEMHDVVLEMWMMENGLTAMDCAMIQPTYGGSSGPSLKGYRNDTLVDLLAHHMNYEGAPDSCTISFQVNRKGKLIHASVVSGNEVLGKAALRYMKKLDYVPYSSWSMYGTREIVYAKKIFPIRRIFRKLFPKKQKQYEPVVNLKICYGMARPTVQENVVVMIVNDTLHKDTTESVIRIKGHLTDKSTGEALPFVNVVIYDDSGNALSACMTDFDGMYSMVVPKTASGKLRMEIRYVGYETVSIPDLVFTSQNISVQMNGGRISLDDYECVGLPCLGTIYVLPKSSP